MVMILFLILILLSTAIITIIIRAREYIWLVETEWPDVRERERMANYRTPSQVLLTMNNMTMMVMVLVMMAKIRQ